MIGPWEILLILVVVLVIFGAGRLPSVMGDLAKGVKAFKSGLKDEDAAQKTADRKKEESQGQITHVRDDESSPKKSSLSPDERSGS
jgi:sec-independent protein translocase protein TatA